MGFGKSRASLSVLDFIRISTIVKATNEDLNKIEPFINTITEKEGLINHYEALKERIKDNQKLLNQKKR